MCCCSFQKYIHIITAVNCSVFEPSGYYSINSPHKRKGVELDAYRLDISARHDSVRYCINNLFIMYMYFFS